MIFYNWSVWLTIGFATFVIAISTVNAETKAAWGLRLMELLRKLEKEIKRLEKEDK